jgi:hypothetical protein
VTAGALERFLSLVRREMRAEDVRVLSPSDTGSEAPNVMHGRLQDGRRVAVVFAEPPSNRPALTRRLDMLLRTFAQSLDEPPASARSARPPLRRSLQDELRALANRARAVDALVIDANSPIVWGSAVPSRLSKPPPEPGVSLVDVSRDLAPASSDGPMQDTPSSPAPGDEDRDKRPRRDESGPGKVESEDPSELSQHAVDAARALPAIATLRKGGHLHHVSRDNDLAYAAHSFAGIYVLVLVFEAPFDELRAERAVSDALARIERLVLALPPLDPRPAPTAGVIRMRRPRRR